MILPGFVTAETAGFEPVELKKKMQKKQWTYKNVEYFVEYILKIYMIFFAKL